MTRQCSLWPRGKIIKCYLDVLHADISSYCNKNVQISLFLWGENRCLMCAFVVGYTMHCFAFRDTPLICKTKVLWGFQLRQQQGGRTRLGRMVIFN